MKRNEYVAHPTAAAIDTAMARALSFESEQVEEQTEEAAKSAIASITGKVSGKVKELLGQSGSFERGFVQAAGLIVVGLLVGRAVTENTALLSAVVPLSLLASLVTHKAIRGIAPTREWLATRPRQIVLGLACSPALTWFSRDSFNRSEKATLWTAWAAALIGLLALTAG